MALTFDEGQQVGSRNPHSRPLRSGPWEMDSRQLAEFDELINHALTDPQDGRGISDSVQLGLQHDLCSGVLFHCSQNSWSRVREPPHFRTPGEDYSRVVIGAWFATM